MKQDFAQFKAPLTPQLPQPLPAGEHLIWQGKPSFAGLAWRAFHIREVAVYFGLVLVLRLWANVSNGVPFDTTLVSAAMLVLIAAGAVGVLSLLALLFSRAATYTLTSRRVLFQFGVALPMTMNIPLDKISSAALKTYRDGSGDIPLTLTDNKASFLLMWPHVRPWRLRSAEPMLRAIPDAAVVAAKLNDALSGQPGPVALAINPSTALSRAHGIPANAVAAA